DHSFRDAEDDRRLRECGRGGYDLRTHLIFSALAVQKNGRRKGRFPRLSSHSEQRRSEPAGAVRSLSEPEELRDKEHLRRIKNDIGAVPRPLYMGKHFNEFGRIIRVPVIPVKRALLGFRALEVRKEPLRGLADALPMALVVPVRDRRFRVIDRNLLILAWA